MTPRTPWSAAFPPVVIHCEVGDRDGHAQYGAAKAGDARAALELADELIDDAALSAIGALIGEQGVTLLPVVAEETTGFNAIPDAMAQAISNRIGSPAVSGEIVQINKVGHTRAKSFQRLVTPAQFAGHVTPDAKYILVDDHVGLGGTLANLRGHIEANGGRVIGMTTLTESRDARIIALRHETARVLWEKHGKALDNLWKAQFGHGIDCLTEVEGQILCRQQSVDVIEGLLAQAEIETRGRGLAPAFRRVV